MAHYKNNNRIGHFLILNANVFRQMWFLSHLHLIMVVTGLLMGIVGFTVAVSFGVCYSVKKNGGKNPEMSEHYRPIVPEEEVEAGDGSHQDVRNEPQQQQEEQDWVFDL